MTQRKVLVLTTPQSFDELDATDIPALSYAAANAYVPGGTDVAVADGGTGSSTASDARTNLGLGTLATQSGTFSGTSSNTNTGDQTLSGLGAAPSTVPYLVTTADSGLSAEVVVPAAVLSVLDDTTVAAMVDTLGGASATGTGGLVRATSPALVTPALGTPASGVATNLTGTAAGLTAGAVTTGVVVPAIVVLTGDVVNNNGTPDTIADVTALSFAVVSGSTYWFRFVIPYTSAATTTGSRWSINGPAATLLLYRSRYGSNSTTDTTNPGMVSYDLPAASNAGSPAAGSIAIVEGIITPSANGTVIARFASEITASAVTAKAGAVVFYQKIA